MLSERSIRARTTCRTVAEAVEGYLEEKVQNRWRPTSRRAGHWVQRAHEGGAFEDDTDGPTIGPNEERASYRVNDPLGYTERTAHEY